MGRPSYKPVIWYKSFLYPAANWKTARRAVAKLEHHFGESFPRAGFMPPIPVQRGALVAARMAADERAAAAEAGVVCCRIQQRRREQGEVSMELAVGAGLAPLLCAAAVEERPRSGYGGFQSLNSKHPV